MQSNHKILLLQGAVILGMTGLTFMAFFAFQEQLLGGGLSSLTESVRVLEQEGKTAQQLEEKHRQVFECLGLIDQLVNDLINQRCDLREAAARWRAVSPEANILVINRVYARGATEKERIILHLFHLVDMQLKQQPSACAEVLARLRQEKALLEAEDHRGERGPEMTVETFLPTDQRQ